MDDIVNKIEENIRVNIREAHNVYFNCHIYSKSDEKNSSFGTENDLNEDHTQRCKVEKQSTSVQTEPDDTNFSYDKINNHDGNSNGKKNEQTNIAEHSAQQGLPSENADEEFCAISKTFPVSDEEKSVMHYKNVENPSQRSQRLLDAPENLSSKAELKDLKPRIPDRAQTSPPPVGNAPLHTKCERTLFDLGSTSDSSTTESPSTTSNELNAATNDSDGGNVKDIRTPLDLFFSLVRKFRPCNGNQAEASNSDLIKIIIIHSEADTDLAKEIVSRLRKNNRFWVAANYELEHIMNVYADCRKTVVDWADILVPLISNKWLSEIDNVNLCQKASSLNAKYTFQVMQSCYMSLACTNLKIVAALKEGTDRSYRERPEIRDAIVLMRDYQKFEKMVINFYRVSQTFRKSQLLTTGLRQSSASRQN